MRAERGSSEGVKGSVLGGADLAVAAFAQHAQQLEALGADLLRASVHTGLWNLKLFTMLHPTAEKQNKAVSLPGAENWANESIASLQSVCLT